MGMNIKISSKPSSPGANSRAIIIVCFVLSFVCVPTLSTVLVNGTSHPFSVHDMLAMDRVSDPQVSPDGTKIVFVLRKTDLAADKGRTDLWLVDSDGTGLRQLTTAPEADFNPRWSPQGDIIYFLSGRSKSVQIWKIRTDGGEASRISDLPLEISNLLVSPDGKHLAFTVDVFPGMTIAQTKEKLDKIAKRQAKGRIYTRTFIRHWDVWNDGRRSHLFIMETSGGAAKDLMPAMDADTPSRPFGGTEELCFSPDGKEMIFTARDAGRQESWSTDFNLYRVAIDGRSFPENITSANKAWDTQPVFSPDGKTLAYLAMKRPAYESDRLRIVLMDCASGKKHVLTENWDRSPGTFCFSADGKKIFATAGNLGQKSLFAIDINSGSVQTLVHEGWIGSVQTAGDKIIFGMDSLQSPVELYSILPDGTGMKALTRINKGKLARARMGDYEQFTFEGWNDETVYAYIVKPIDFDSDKKYPVAFLIHGGPQGSFGNHFHYRWNPQVYAGAGYAVVMVDFHGSTGYGQAFTDSIRGDWGGKPLADLKKGLAAALRRYPWMDGRRVAALGASFGGYMINWIAGNWPDRFRCLVNHDGNLDERMAYFDTDELWFPEWDHMGTPWDNPQSYEKHNPVNFVKNWKTPMLVIHGARDYRVVDSQGIGTFNALQRRGIPSKLLYFPDEDHWVQNPHNSILWHETVIDWINQWTK